MLKIPQSTDHLSSETYIDMDNTVVELDETHEWIAESQVHNTQYLQSIYPMTSVNLHGESGIEDCAELPH